MAELNPADRHDDMKFCSALEGAASDRSLSGSDRAGYGDDSVLGGQSLLDGGHTRRYLWSDEYIRACSRCDKWRPAEAEKCFVIGHYSSLSPNEAKYMELSHKKAVFMSFATRWNKRLHSGSKSFKILGSDQFSGNN
jgi:hypothetical protein